jgi:hypothetical protein
MRPLWIKAAVVLVLVWGIAAGAIYWARSARVTPETLAKYIETHSMEGRTGNDRSRVLDTVANQLNQLDFEQRREMRMGRKLDKFFRSLTPQEQSEFLDRTLPTGFRQFMQSLNKMERAQRKQFVEKALRDMEERGGGERPQGEPDKLGQKIIDEGFKSYYREASAETKMDIAPLLEQMQRNMQGR